MGGHFDEVTGPMVRLTDGTRENLVPCARRRVCHPNVPLSAACKRIVRFGGWACGRLWLGHSPLPYSVVAPVEAIPGWPPAGTAVWLTVMNIAIVAGLCSSWSVRLVGRRYAAGLATAAIALYTVFVGASASVLRAALMGIIAVWGQHLGWQYPALLHLLPAV